MARRDEGGAEGGELYQDRAGAVGACRSHLTDNLPGLGVGVVSFATAHEAHTNHGLGGEAASEC